MSKRGRKSTLDIGHSDLVIGHSFVIRISTFVIHPPLGYKINYT